MRVNTRITLLRVLSYPVKGDIVNWDQPMVVSIDGGRILDIVTDEHGTAIYVESHGGGQYAVPLDAEGDPEAGELRSEDDPPRRREPPIAESGRGPRVSRLNTATACRHGETDDDEEYGPRPEPMYDDPASRTGLR